MVKIIHQHDERDCGAACLSMIAWHYGLKQPLAKYRFLTNTDKNGTNLQGIIKGAEKIGLLADAQTGSPEELYNGLASGELSFPLIAHTVSDGLLHFVVLFGMKRGKLIVGDPGKGLRHIRFDSFASSWTGYIITFHKTTAFKQNDTRPKYLSSFFHLLKGQYLKLFVIMGISIAVAAIGILGAFVFEFTIDQHSIGNINIYDLSVIFGSLMILYCVQAIIQLIRGFLIANLSRKLDIHLSLSFFRHILELSPSSINQYQVGDYLTRLSDTASIRFAISGAVVTLALDVLMVIACGWILFLENSTLFFISLSIIVSYAIIALIYHKPVKHSNRLAMHHHAMFQSYFKESIDGFDTIKTTQGEKQVNHRATALFCNFANATFKNNLITASQDIIADAIELIGTAGILWVGFGLVFADTLSMGSLITFYALLAFFIEPIKNLIELQPMIQTGVVAAERLYDVFSLPKERSCKSSSAPDTVSTWSLQNVDFNYETQDLLLSNVSLSVSRGEKIAIIGNSGSGKTTIAKLLLRFYIPRNGHIFLDDVNSATISSDSIRKKIAYVGQDTFLFADTIKNNLLLGNPSVTDEDMQLACRHCYIDEFISTLPLGYDTPLDENGSNLSDGQRQRLALARALLQKPQLLILDEATCHLDSKTSELVLQKLFSMTKHTACVIITHQLSIAKTCDRVYLLEQGQIVASGNHESLLHSNLPYANFWKKDILSRHSD